jgi:hypothetical protein
MSHFTNIKKCEDGYYVMDRVRDIKLFGPFVTEEAAKNASDNYEYGKEWNRDIKG